MAAEVKTLILRFRDLVTPSGDTIARHQDIAKEKGHVWWGWWNKAGETIPDEVFRSLLSSARSADGLPLFLVDSGSSRVFQATCKDILWSAAHERIPCPDLAATPSYYKDQAYFVWFKFSAVTSADALILNEYTYVQVDSFFSDGASLYTPFYGKRIHSVRELIQQNRSIWFVREARGSDPVHEISFFDSARIEPNDFPRTYRQSASRNLLWVSDLHYSVDNHHAFPFTPTISKKSVGSAIEKCLEERNLGSLAGIIASGDLTWKASPEEYNLTHSFFDWQRQWAGLGNYDFLVCPGNHDIKFSSDPARKDLPVTEAPDTAQSAYVDFYRQLFFKAPNSFLSSGRKFLVGNAFPVEIACLNSSLLEQQKDLFQGHGFIGDAQLDDAASEMGWASGGEGPRALRILVVHHHLLPVTFREDPKTGQVYSVALDAEALARWIVRHRVNLVLHGHMHQPFSARVERSVEINHPERSWHRFHVVGLGSTGVAKDHLGEVGKNTFGLLCFEKDHLDVKVFTIDPVNPAEDLWSLRIPYGDQERQ
ncbi:MAG: metallophosphoesterase [Thermoanaerobaculia bacterium]